MFIVRTLVLLLLGGALVSFAMYLGTRQERFRRLGILLVKWTVIAGLGFFAVLILERIAVMI